MSSSILHIEPLGFPWKTKDPFLFCAHHADAYPIGNGKFGPDKSELAGRQIGNDFIIKDGWRMYHGSKVPGFPYHPHRGFETVTINKAGYVDHADSLGASGRFGAGDVQWMTAGKGVQHSEMFPLLHSDKENHLEIFQIWLNLPKVKKFVEPHFKMLWKEVIPEVEHKDENGRICSLNIIAGSYKNTKAPSPTPESWAADEANQVNIWTLKMEAGASFQIPSTDRGLTRTLYFYKGSEICIDDTKISQNTYVELDSNEGVSIINGVEEGYFLFLQGKPIQEPVVQYGPFVMNTEAEIQQTYREFQETQFGGWEWPSSAPVHGSEIRRFARYADGRVENGG